MSEEHLPPLRFDALTRVYDRVVAFGMPEESFRGRLAAQVALQAGERLLDLGCGTGAMTLRFASATPGAEIVALDPDATAIGIAKRKAAAAGVQVEWHECLPWDAPFADASFDRIVSSLVFHHLRHADKRRALACALRWLRPRGELHIADWGRADSALMRAAFLPVQLLDGFETTAENVAQGLVPALEKVGFEAIEETQRRCTALGTLSLYRARVAAP
jgi:ubiquinone/menaquinone biosynthesis C-methylase UbiE